MSEKRRLHVLVSADEPSTEGSRTLMPEVLPNPRSNVRTGGARERTMQQLARLRAATPNADAPAEDDEDG